MRNMAAYLYPKVIHAPSWSSVFTIYKDQVSYLKILTKSPDHGLKDAARLGDKGLVCFFLGNGPAYWGWGMCDAWNWGMRWAAFGGHRDLVDFFIEKGASDWEEGMRSAARGGHKDLVEFFIARGASDWDFGMYSAALGGHKDLVDFFIVKGATDWEGGMRDAVQGGHKDLVEFFIGKGASDWEAAMFWAGSGGHKDLVLFFFEKGAKLDTAIHSAEQLGNKDVEFCKSKKMDASHV